jgi:hypothetical protein
MCGNSELLHGVKILNWERVSIVIFFSGAPWHRVERGPNNQELWPIDTFDDNKSRTKSFSR